jgi:site-specific DNA recombinase
MRLLQAARLSRVGEAATGLEKQDLDAQGYASMGGHTIVGTAADTDVSGDTDPWARPQLGPWLSDPALIAQYDGIVASHVDRLARSTVHFMRLLHWADEHGKTVITVGEQGIDFSSPMGKLLGYIISWLGEQELAAITRRNVATQHWLKDNGYLVGRPSFGYVAVAKGDHKTLEPDPVLVPYVREMVERYLRGDTLMTICKWLDDEHVSAPNRGHWAPNSVSRILRNPILTGRRKDASGKTILRVEPVIDAATWRQLQHKLSTNPRRRATASATGLLTNILLCGKCGGVMYLRSSTSTTRKSGKRYVYQYYRCHGTAREPSACKNMIPLPDIESWVADQMTGDVIGRQELVETVVIPGHSHDDEIEQVEQDFRDLDMGSPDFDTRLAALRAERQRLQALPSVPDQTLTQRTGVTIADHWNALDTAGKRDYLLSSGAQVHAVRVAPGQRVGRPTRYPRLSATIAITPRP